MSPFVRTALVFVPELGRAIEVRGPASTDTPRPEIAALPLEVAARRAVRALLIAPRLSDTELGALSDETINRLAEAQMRLSPTASKALEAMADQRTRGAA